MAPPRSRMGAISAEERATVMQRSPVGAKYDTPVNRESAHEMLAKRVEAAMADAPASSTSARDDDAASRPEPATRRSAAPRGRQSMAETVAKQMARTATSQITRQILRGVLGGILGGRRR